MVLIRARKKNVLYVILFAMKKKYYIHCKAFVWLTDYYRMKILFEFFFNDENKSKRIPPQKHF